MRVEIRLFAVCRERMGQERFAVEVQGESATVAGVREALAAAAPSLRPLMGAVRWAVNCEMVGDDAPIRAGDDVAIIPPVSGGSSNGLFEIRSTPIELADVDRAVRSPRHGAIVSFLGIVRDRSRGLSVLALEYEAYAEMATKSLRAIGDEISVRWPDTQTAILHRVGRLDVGEVAVAIAVGSPHRDDAFEACRHAIERLKQDVPIWKKEFHADGSEWVGVGS